MERKEMLNYLILETAGCTQWSHAELIDRVLRLVESKGMLPPKSKQGRHCSCLIGGRGNGFNWEKSNGE